MNSSPGAGTVLRRAQELSRARGVELVLVHVAQSTNPGQHVLPVPFDPSTYRSGALERGAAVLEEIGREALRRGARGRIELGPWPARLAAVAAAEQAELVVVGRPHSRRSRARLQRRSPCAVAFV